MIRVFDDPTKDENCISSEEMLILQARILANIAKLVKNSKLLEIFPSYQLLGSPKEEELGRLHHYYDNALKNNSSFEITPVMEKEVFSISQKDKDSFIEGLFKILRNEEPICDECKSYIMKVANCFDSHEAAIEYNSQEVINAVESEE